MVTLLPQIERTLQIDHVGTTDAGELNELDQRQRETEDGGDEQDADHRPAELEQGGYGGQDIRD